MAVTSPLVLVRLLFNELLCWIRRQIQKYCYRRPFQLIIQRLACTENRDNWLSYREFRVSGFSVNRRHEINRKCRDVIANS
ncbi:hypothetical protein J6590_106111 [Homalodisca vitripennis]|nr:hypothetical protein J6590_106111 [Homalodisca vitripennis]